MIHRNSIANYIFVYWFALLLWQNLFTSSLRGFADTTIKLFLLGYLIIGYIRNSTNIRKNNIIFISLFWLSMFITFILTDFSSSGASLNTLIYYLFPCIFVFLVYGLGSRSITCTNEEIRRVNKLVITVTLVSVIYTALFDWAQFSAALSATSGYGNELHGYFASMYEFALYLFYSIVGCIYEIEDKNKNHLRGTLCYYCLIFIFFFTMVLTFSRTAIIGCIAYLIIYSILNKKSKVSKVIIFFFALTLFLCLVIPQLNKYVFYTVWKGGVSNSRERLYAASIEYYLDGTMIKKIFGRGITAVRGYFSKDIGYGSIHNGYLQILTYYGWIGILWLIVMIYVQIKKILICAKYDTLLAVEAFALLVVCLLTMLPSTVIVFNSSIDAFFLTAMFIVLPRYRINNAIIKENHL